MSAPEIRTRIAALMAEYGAVLNAWPPAAQIEYLRLSQMLRRLESSKM